MGRYRASVQSGVELVFKQGGDDENIGTGKVMNIACRQMDRGTLLRSA